MRRLTLRAAEVRRLQSQSILDCGKSAAERNRLGQFATPPGLALDMAVLAKEYLPARGGVRLLDPCVGTGVFFYAARTVFGPRLRSAVGFEIDPEFAAACERLWSCLGLCVRREDFCAVPVPADRRERPTLILCNPPYVRHHHLSARQKANLQREARQAGFPISGLAGLYCYFLLLAQRWLAPGGLGVWVVPAEFLDVNYGHTVKQYLASRMTLLRLHRFDPDDVQFADALVSSVVVVLRNEPPPLAHEVELAGGGTLSAPRLLHRISLSALDPCRKWGPLFAGTSGLHVNGPTEGEPPTIGDLFLVRRGLATGANEYFILEREQAAALGLPEQFLRPILPSPRHIASQLIEAADDGFPAGLPALVLLDCDLSWEVVQTRYPALARYLNEGERRGIPERYLPAHRRPWYRQESRPPAPILCTYMGRQNGGRAIRFLRNKSGATAPNVYLLLYPRPQLQAMIHAQPEVLDRVFETLVATTARLVPGGRVYGGGLNKIEPKELEAIELPAWVYRPWPSATATGIGKQECHRA
jgi:hypothetical protein